jgi:hypothetical protein
MVGRLLPAQHKNKISWKYPVSKKKRKEGGQECQDEKSKHMPVSLVISV